MVLLGCICAGRSEKLQQQGCICAGRSEKLQQQAHVISNQSCVVSLTLYCPSADSNLLILTPAVHAPRPQLKKILSANAEASLSVECLMEDMDLRGNMSREQFEKLAEPVLARLRVPLEEALASSGGFLLGRYV